MGGRQLRSRDRDGAGDWLIYMLSLFGPAEPVMHGLSVTVLHRSLPP
jgi:hypothetical protein